MRHYALAIAVLMLVGTALAEPPATQTQPATQSTPKFYGTEITGSRIVLVLDHTGAMVENFDFLRQETKHFLQSLSPQQQVGIVVFSESVDVLGKKLPEGKGPVDWELLHANPPVLAAHLVSATDDAKRALAEQIDNVEAKGETCQILEPYRNALKSAFIAKPDTIVFLTTGNFDPKLADAARAMNPKKDTVVHTVMFVRGRDQGVETLKKIAADNAGTYKFVSEIDLTR